MRRDEEAWRIEADLARRLRAAPKDRRTAAAREAYAELYRRVHWHPDLSKSQAVRRARVRQVRYAYDRWISRATAVLEVGAGSCEVLADVGPGAPRARFAGIDVARAPRDSSAQALPPNVRFIQAAAGEIPFAGGTFDFVFSSQVLEHLHPDDVPDHLGEVARVLRPGGWMGLDTPNRLSGPHDVSRHFTDEPTGFHLKEWTYTELAGLLRRTGFDTIRTRVLPGRVSRALRFGGPGPLLGAGFKSALEKPVARVPHRGLRRLAARALGLDGIYLYARRAAH